MITVTTITKWIVVIKIDMLWNWSNVFESIMHAM